MPTASGHTKDHEGNYKHFLKHITGKTLSTVATMVSGQLARYQPQNLVNATMGDVFVLLDSRSVHYAHRYAMDRSLVASTVPSYRWAARNSRRVFGDALVHLSFHNKELLLCEQCQYALNRSSMAITYFRGTAASGIVRMYALQALAARQIRAMELFRNRDYAWILRLREDLFFLGPVRLPSLNKCDFVYKKCLSWGGVNMRWQLIRQPAALTFLSGQLHFYNRARAINPEIFEKQHLRALNLRLCHRPVTDIPVTVSRVVSRTTNGDVLRVCFPTHETRRCLPQNKTVAPSCNRRS